MSGVPSSLRTRADASSARDALESLCVQVTASESAVALYDVTSSRIVAMSAATRVFKQLVDVDLEEFDFVAASRDAQRLRGLCATLCDHDVYELSWQVSIVAGDGREVGATARARRAMQVTDRAVYVVRFEPDGSVDGGYEDEVWLAPLLADDRAEDDEEAARRRRAEISRLRHHLTRIAAEVDDSGVARVDPAPELSGVPGLQDLSARQFEIVTRLVRGERVSMIARALFLSPSTVRNHLSIIYRKVGVASQADLVELLFMHRANNSSH